MTRILSAIGFASLFSTSPSEAIILYGKDNTGNLTDPGSGVPFTSVARVASTLGSDGTGGSGVYLGNGFMLTAAHLGDSELNSVTFDGVTNFSRDLSYDPVQIGSSDLKVFKLNSNPAVPAVSLYTGSAELTTGATMVGWGRGRAAGEPINTDQVEIAGGATPLVRRWGTNDPNRTIGGFTYTNGSSFTFDALETTMGNAEGANEAAATFRDSGSGFFQEIGGSWYLTGITAALLRQGPPDVTFGNDVAGVGSVLGTDYGLLAGGGDTNIFVRVSSYAGDINALIPEPSSAILVGLSSLLLAARRRR